MSTLSHLHVHGFRKLSIDDRNEIKKFLREYPQYSDYNFTSLFAWDTENELQIRLEPGRLGVVFQDYETKDKFLSFLGNKHVDEHIFNLIELSKSCGYGDVLRLVPQSTIDSLVHKDQFAINEDRNNFDYILSVSHLAGLLGSKNEDRRHKIKRFLASYGDGLEIRQMDITSAHGMNEIIDCLTTWETLRGQTPVSNKIEREAITRLLHHSNELGLLCLAFYIEGKIAAFTIFEVLTDDTAIVHFEKCHLHFQGIASFVRHQTAVRLEEEGVSFINYEQDLGIQGLRKSKEMLHPVRFLKKYTVRLKTT